MVTKNLVICLDGTWNTPDQSDRGRQVPSNVVKIARAIERKTVNPQPRQHVYYDSGVGTLGLKDRLVGGLTGRGISENIQAAYQWLIETLQERDRIYLFGFSRGAYSARSLAGLIGVCGIPRTDARPIDAVVREAYDIYRERKTQNRKVRAVKFVDDNQAIRSAVHFIGVWDTVGSLGVPTRGPLGWWTRRRSGFHDVSLGSHVRSAFHALAINERRGPFNPTLWDTDDIESGQTVVQAWFPGVHSNIGGGYVDYGLSDRALLWMIYNANARGLCFDEKYVDLHLRPNWFGEIRDSMSLFYRAPFLSRPRTRSIGITSPRSECLHISAIKRWGDMTAPEPEPSNVVNVSRSIKIAGSGWETEFNLGDRAPLQKHDEES